MSSVKSSVMSTCIVVPMKAPACAKRRLSGLLNGAQREAVALALYRQTLTFFAHHFSDTPLLVVTASEQIADIAVSHGAQVLLEPVLTDAERTLLLAGDKEAGLNHAVTLAAHWCREQGFESQLLLPADIAELNVAEIRHLLSAAGEMPSVVVCPAHDGGTNALLTSPPGVIPFRFGKQSSRAHLAEAHQRAIPARLLTLAQLTRDIDTPDDLRHWQGCLTAIPAPDQLDNLSSILAPAITSPTRLNG
ncbi:2-phospho-L-lactate guanylyltransferase [Nitrincola alkalilacustris]|uniref:2-phospho-L-lactate guanylyltransferase n=1 Tax=Nitrincola alkalilacustris TaxID=1571224 RepID=UPI0014568F76|nr:2-phospho-L-lactate guanylyltransferase [Nitrincola alkalilacustris]